MNRPTTISNSEKTELEDFCNEYDYNFRPTYSGRGMMGESCIGFVTDCEFSLAFNLAQHLSDGSGDNLGLMAIFDGASPHTDSMGHGTIIYFPSISVE